jgi:hypothetical protein
MIQKYRSLSSISRSNLYIQTYRSHPFVDVYGANCDKGVAFDLITNILNPNDNEEMGILYLGDSENDNPAFRKASTSIGIISDKRLSPRLDCQYLIEYKHLPDLLRHLIDDRFMFSESLLTL